MRQGRKIGKKPTLWSIFFLTCFLHARLSNKKKFARKDPETKKWQPLEVGAKSTKIPPGPAGTPPTVKGCDFGRFWPISPLLRPNAILLFLGLFLQFFCYLKAENKKIKIKKKIDQSAIFRQITVV